MSIEATTVVSFNTSEDTADYVFNLSLDDELNLNSDGDVISSFVPEDIVYLLANKSSNVTIDDVVATDGTISSLGSVSRDGEELHLFTERETEGEDTYDVPIIANSVDVLYMGKRQGAVSQDVSSIGVTTLTPDIKKTPFLADIKYSYSASSYKLVSPYMDLEEDETYSIAVVFYITVEDA